jgi:hypothetical protein
VGLIDACDATFAEAEMLRKRHEWVDVAVRASEPNSFPLNITEKMEVMAEESRAASSISEVAGGSFPGLTVFG